MSGPVTPPPAPGATSVDVRAVDAAVVQLANIDRTLQRIATALERIAHHR